MNDYMNDYLEISRRSRTLAKIVTVKKALKPVMNLKKFRASFPRMDISSTKVLRQLRDKG